MYPFSGCSFKEKSKERPPLLLWLPCKQASQRRLPLIFLQGHTGRLGCVLFGVCPFVASGGNQKEHLHSGDPPKKTPTCVLSKHWSNRNCPGGQSALRGVRHAPRPVDTIPPMAHDRFRVRSRLIFQLPSHKCCVCGRQGNINPLVSVVKDLVTHINPGRN